MRLKTNKTMKIICFTFVIVITLISSVKIDAQKMSAKNQSKVAVKYLKTDFSVSELDNKAWSKVAATTIDKYWSGENVPDGRRFKAKLLWSKTALYVRFEANQAEPLIVSDAPNLTSKTKGLWDRDVCEIFLAPNRAEFRKYFEFEIAPTGEWIDLGIYQKPDERITDWDYNSGMQSAARIEKNKVVSAIKIEWTAFGATPKAGDVWLGNILRCVGAGATRGYLTWQPTFTKEPSFHIPERFGDFEFTK